MHIILLLLAFISTFFLGFFTKTFLLTENPTPQIITQPLVDNTPAEVRENASTRFTTGKFYFDDGFFLVTKNPPFIALLGDVTRLQNQEGNYTQTTRISYLDGKNNKRQLATNTGSTPAILTNQMVKNWSTVVDPSRVLKEQVNLEISAGGKTFKINSGILQNEMVIRSLPGYTKFFSNGDATVEFDGKKIPAYFVYSKIYSLNASELQFYTTPLGLNTDFLVFWDELGGVSLVDKTSVSNPTDKYQTHQIMFYDDPVKSVTRSFVVEITKDQNTPPKTYRYVAFDPLNLSLEATTSTSLDKAPNQNYKWFLSLVNGTVTKSNGQKINGVGLAEFIKD